MSIPPGQCYSGTQYFGGLRYQFARSNNQLTIMMSLGLLFASGLVVTLLSLFLNLRSLSTLKWTASGSPDPRASRAFLSTSEWITATFLYSSALTECTFSNLPWFIQARSWPSRHNIQGRPSADLRAVLQSHNARTLESWKSGVHPLIRRRTVSKHDAL